MEVIAAYYSKAVEGLSLASVGGSSYSNGCCWARSQGRTVDVDRGTRDTWAKVSERKEDGTMMRTAECACGSFRIRVDGEPAMVGACSCLSCQKRTGSVCGVGAYFPKDKVEVLSGPDKIFVRPGESGINGEFHFCPSCGSTVYWESQIIPGLCGVAVGCFADPSFPSPQIAAWDENRHGWVRFPPGAEMIKTQLSLAELAAVLAPH
jgi:hypothetical protein